MQDVGVDTPWIRLLIYLADIKNGIFGSWQLCLSFLLVPVCIFLFFRHKLSDRADQILKNKKLLLLLFCFIFLIFNLHEYLAGNLGYSRKWANPFELLLLILPVLWGLVYCQKFLRIVIAVLIFLFCFQGTIGLHQTLNKNLKKPDFLLKDRFNNIYVFNPPGWLSVIQETTSFLEHNLKKDETFFVIPYGPIYYFLTHRNSPAWQLSFQDYQHITPNEEMQTIQDLMKKNVRWVVVLREANAKPSEKNKNKNIGSGAPPILMTFIARNYELVASFGDWREGEDWGLRHATAIFRKKLP